MKVITHSPNDTNHSPNDTTYSSNDNLSFLARSNFGVEFNSMSRKIVLEIITLLFIILWVYAAVSKLSEFETFKYQLGKSPFISDMVELIAWSLPGAELIIALMLIVESTRLIGLYLSFFLMVLFAGYIYAMLHHSYYVPCSCGGILSIMTWEQHIVFNIAFVFASIIAILIYQGNVNTDKRTIKIISAQKTG